MNKTTVHNLSEESSVGSINNELKIRGKKNLESASRKLILNKSFDLLEKKPAHHFKTFRKPAQAVSALKMEWNEKMKVLESNAFAEKEKINTHFESVKYKDLEFLKSKGGPFTTPDEVDSYMKKKEIDPNDKKPEAICRSKICKNTSFRLKHLDPLFSLRRDNKNLLNHEYSQNLKSFLGNARKTQTIISKRTI